MYDRISAGEFDNHLSYPSKPKKPAVLVKKVQNLSDNEIATIGQVKQDYEKQLVIYRELVKGYQTIQAKADATFRDAALDDVGLLGHEKAGPAYAYAWYHGHSCGYSEVYKILCDITDIIL